MGLSNPQPRKYRMTPACLEGSALLPTALEGGVIFFPSTFKSQGSSSQGQFMHDNFLHVSPFSKALYPPNVCVRSVPVECPWDGQTQRRCDGLKVGTPFWNTPLGEQNIPFKRKTGTAGEAVWGQVFNCYVVFAYNGTRLESIEVFTNHRVGI